MLYFFAYPTGKDYFFTIQQVVCIVFNRKRITQIIERPIKGIIAEGILLGKCPAHIFAKQTILTSFLIRTFPTKRIMGIFLIFSVEHAFLEFRLHILRTIAVDYTEFTVQRFFLFGITIEKASVTQIDFGNLINLIDFLS